MFRQSYGGIKMSTVIEMLNSTAKANPDKTFLIAADKTYTYEEFNKETTLFAKALLKRGVNKGDAVIVQLGRESSFLVTFFGVLKAGAIFVPAGMTYPEGRISKICETSDAVLLIKKEAENNAFNLKLGTASYSDICSDFGMLEDGITLPDVTPQDSAMMLFTSGSTGVPKGVLTAHRGLAAVGIYDETNSFVYYFKNKGHVLLTVTTQTFALAYDEVIAAISSGLTIVFADDNASQNPYLMAELGQKYNADIVGGTPSRINQYLDIPEYVSFFKNVNVLFAAGERFPNKLFDRISSISDCIVINAYGLSETSAPILFGILNEDPSCAGTFFKEWKTVIIDENHNEVPDGEKGVLCLKSDNLMLGYVKLPEETKKRTVTVNGEVYYYTGDVAYRLDNGKTLIVGRSDFQIKLRGLRIEPGEIETVVTEFKDANIPKCVVKVNNISGNDHLVAYFISNDEVDTEKLKEHLAYYLPTYMVPNFYMHLDVFPTNPNGKIDYNLLPVYEVKETEYVEPETDTEIKVANITKKIIGEDKISAIEKLGDLGFSSLSYITLATAILDEFNVEIKLTDLLMGNSTITSISKYIDENNENAQADTDIEQLDKYPLAPQLYQFTIKAGYVDQYREIVFNKLSDELKARNAIMSVINSSAYMYNCFAKENDTWYQIPFNGELCSEADIPIIYNDPTEEDKKMFMSKEYDMNVDKRLWDVTIYKGDKVTALLHMHHSLIDNKTIDKLLDGIESVCNGKELKNEEGNKYYVYSYKMDEYYKNNAKAIDNRREKLLNDAGITVKNTQPQLNSIKAQGFYIPFSKEDLHTDKYSLEPADYGFGLFAKALLTVLKKKEIIVNYFFGGRNEAKYFENVGYYPYRVPVKVEDRDNILEEIGDVVVKAIADSNPYDDEIYRRIAKSEYADMFIEYNCVSLIKGNETVTLTSMVRDDSMDVNSDNEKIQPNIRITAYVKPDGLMARIDYEEGLLSKEDLKTIWDMVGAVVPTAEQAMM